MLSYLDILYASTNIKHGSPNSFMRKYYELLFVLQRKNGLTDLENSNPSIKDIILQSANIEKIESFLNDKEIINNITDPTIQSKEYRVDFEDNIGQNDKNHVIIKYLGGKNILLFDKKILNLVSNKDKKDLSILVNNIKNKFKELLIDYCINCSNKEKINKLNKLFNLNINSEQEFYDKHNITVRDLNLYIYLNIIEFIVTNKKNKKYNLLLLNILDDIIIEHVNYIYGYFYIQKNIHMIYLIIILKMGLLILIQ